MIALSNPIIGRMSPIRPSLALGLCLTLACLSPAARATLLPLAWDASGQMSRTLAVPAGKFLEICGKVRAGEVIDWQFEAAAPLDFNIHFHEGDKVEYPEKRDATPTLAGTFRPGREHDYCWMWTNRSANAVSVSIRLRQQR